MAYKSEKIVGKAKDACLIAAISLSNISLAEKAFGALGDKNYWGDRAYSDSYETLETILFVGIVAGGCYLAGKLEDHIHGLLYSKKYEKEFEDYLKKKRDNENKKSPF